MARDPESIILTRQELRIMKLVWEMDTATVREVWEALSQRKATAYTTVLTLMGILEEKGALTHVRNGRAFVYRPVLTREQATQNQIRDLLARFFDGRPERLIESLLNEECVNPDCLARVRAILEERLQPQMV